MCKYQLCDPLNGGCGSIYTDDTHLTGDNNKDKVTKCNHCGKNMSSTLQMSTKDFIELQGQRGWSMSTRIR